MKPNPENSNTIPTNSLGNNSATLNASSEHINNSNIHSSNSANAINKNGNEKKRKNYPNVILQEEIEKYIIISLLMALKKLNDFQTHWSRVQQNKNH